jgi:predicted metal-dependent hydrolase
MEETVSIAGLPIDCHLVRSRRKSLAVHVRHDRIEVRAPMFVGRSEVLGFLERHREWVSRKFEEKTQRASESLSLLDGGEIFYKARQMTIHLRDAASCSVIVEGRNMIISAPKMTPDKAGAVLKNWLMAQAREYLPQRTRALADHLQLGHKLSEVVFRKTRSKWGHCTAKGRIQYNWLIMLAPDGVIDYMICHEVCHLLHMNHSKKYWQAVASVCPDYKRYVGWLKRHEHRLFF